MRKVTEEYRLEIKDGYPPPKGRTQYREKLSDGALTDLANRIRPGQYVENLSAGSMGKLARFVEEKGLQVVRRIGQGERRGALYVVTKEWLAANPD